MDLRTSSFSPPSPFDSRGLLQFLLYEEMNSKIPLLGGVPLRGGRVPLIRHPELSLCEGVRIPSFHYFKELLNEIATSHRTLLAMT
jgi:hypothetical protein